MSIKDRQAECHGAEIKRTKFFSFPAAVSNFVPTVGKRKVTFGMTFCGKQTQ